jgi:hypothetical protein
MVLTITNNGDHKMDMIPPASAATSTISIPHTIVSVTLTDSGQIEVVRRYPSNLMYMCNPPKPAPDRVTKEIYAVVDGKIAMVKEIGGIHTPATHIPETITFPA